MDFIKKADLKEWNECYLGLIRALRAAYCRYWPSTLKGLGPGRKFLA
jgi:hypothetical protein